MSVLATDTPTPQEMTSAVNGCADYSSIGEEYGGHFLLSSEIRPEIKNEPPEDIDDSHSAMYDDKGDNPKIRLTPTFKLMAVPNPVDPKRKFVCPYENCTKSYGKSSHLRSHLTWHTGIKPFVCHEPNCGKGFTRSDELNRHVRTHTGEKPFECVQCTKKFSRSDHLTKHLATHAKQMQRQPTSKTSAADTAVEADEEPDVKKVFLDLQRPGEHMGYSESLHFMAALLDGSSAYKEPENLTDDPLINHAPIKIKLERPEHSDEYHVVQNTTIPQHCHITAENDLEEKSSLTPECIMPIDSMNGPPTTPEVKPEPSDDVVMPEANVTLSQSPDVSQQKSSDSSGSGDGMGLTMQPMQSFVAEVAYDPERPFRCESCSKRFRRQDDLNRHARTHSGEKPFVCSECNRRFMRSDHLKKHMNTHTKLRTSCKKSAVKTETKQPSY